MSKSKRIRKYYFYKVDFISGIGFCLCFLIPSLSPGIGEGSWEGTLLTLLGIGLLHIWNLEPAVGFFCKRVGG